MDQRVGGSLAYTVDDQGLVLSVREATPPDPATARADAAPPIALRTLVAPLTWEPVQRLLAWGAREGDDLGRTARHLPGGDTPPDATTTKEHTMTHAARDERDIAPYDGTLAGGPEGQARAIDTPPPDPGLNQEVTYDTREPDGYGPDDYRWQPITDPAEIATIEGALAQGIDPPYEVWVDQTPAALVPGDLTPTEEGPTVYAWEQTGPAVGDGQLYEITDPVVLTAYEEAHPLQQGIEIINPADFYDAAWAADAARATAPVLYDARIEALIARGDTWLEVEYAGGGFALGRYDASPIERDTNGWEPVRVGDGPDDLTGNVYPDEATARQAAIAYNGADLAGLELTLDPAPVAFDRDLTPVLDL